MFSGLGGMVMSGMAFGAGSEIAHQAIKAVTGSGKRILFYYLTLSCHIF